MPACYFCKIQDPNEVHFDPQRHQICVVCAVKLWELAQHGLEFEMRGQSVAIEARALTSEPGGWDAGDTLQQFPN